MPQLTDTRLTDALVRSAKPRGNRYDIYDAQVRGFGVRVSPSGSKSWFVMRRVNGKMTRKTLGRYPALTLADARAMAHNVLAKMARGEFDQRRSSMLLRDAVEEWLQRDQAENRTRHQVQLALTNDAIPVLGGRRLTDIRKSDINRVIDGIMDRGAGVQANRTLSYLRRFFNWCVERDYLETNPTTGMPKPCQERGRERVLTPDEIKAIDAAANEMGYPFGPLIRMLILTGQRRDEVAEATWDEIEPEGRKWTIPGSRAKNGRPHVVHLSDETLMAIGALPRIEGQHHLFSTVGDRPVSGFSAAKKRLDKLSGVTGWTLHDLRRSFATHTTESLGISSVVVDKILNHQSGAVRGIAAVYRRGQYLRERQAALDAWSRFVADPQISISKKFRKLREDIA